MQREVPLTLCPGREGRVKHDVVRKYWVISHARVSYMQCPTRGLDFPRPTEAEAGRRRIQTVTV